MQTTWVTYQTADTALQRLFDAAEAGARRNLRRFGEARVLVEGGGYDKIWLETQPMGGEMYAKRDVDAAMNNQLLFMRAQRPDGRLPGSILCRPDGSLVPEFNKFQGFCFPQHALNMYWWAGADTAYLAELGQVLRGFDDYLWRVRDSDGDGCLESWCVYDTGEDNALRYGDAPNYALGETPPTGSAVVPMASMDFMSYSFAARDTLAAISRLLGDPEAAAVWAARARQVADALRRHLWDEARGACFDRDRTGRPIPALIHNNLRCMYWGAFSPDMAARFVREHLTNPAEFWTPLPLPSVAANDPLFRNAPENNWSGQCEGLTYQRAIPALERYGCEPLVTQLGHRLMRAVMDGGYLFPQQFDPFTGAPSRVSARTHEPIAADSPDPVQDAYGPTVLAVLEYFAHLWGVDQRMGEVWFSLAAAPAPYAYAQHWRGRTYRIDSDGKTAVLHVDARELCRVPCGVRVITDAEGNVLRTRRIE